MAPDSVERSVEIPRSLDQPSLEELIVARRGDVFERHHEERAREDGPEPVDEIGDAERSSAYETGVNPDLFGRGLQQVIHRLDHQIVLAGEMMGKSAPRQACPCPDVLRGSGRVALRQKEIESRLDQPGARRRGTFLLCARSPFLLLRAGNYVTTLLHEPS